MQQANALQQRKTSYKNWWMACLFLLFVPGKSCTNFTPMETFADDEPMTIEMDLPTAHDGDAPPLLRYGRG